MGTQQDTIERVDRQFRGVEGLRRRPIGALGPLPGPREEVDVAILGFNEINLGFSFDEEGTYSLRGEFPAAALRIPVPFRGNASALVAEVVANSLDGSAELEVLKNGVGTGMKITIGAGVTGSFGPIAGPVLFEQGDRFSYRIRSVGATSGGLSGPSASVRFDPA